MSLHDCGVAVHLARHHPVDREDLPDPLVECFGEGLATVIGGLFNSIPPTTFTGNVGLVRASNVRSRWVCATAGVFMVLLACLPKVAAVAAALPAPAVGAALLVLFGIIATIGVQTLSRADLTKDRNLITIAVSFGTGSIPAAQPLFFQDFPQELQMVLNSGIVVTAVVAIVLNVLFNHAGSRTPKESTGRQD